MLSRLRKGLSLALTGVSYLMAGAFLAGLIFTIFGTAQAMIDL